MQKARSDHFQGWTQYLLFFHRKYNTNTKIFNTFDMKKII